MRKNEKSLSTILFPGKGGASLGKRDRDSSGNIVLSESDTDDKRAKGNISVIDDLSLHPKSKFKLRVLYLQLVMMAGR